MHGARPRAVAPSSRWKSSPTHIPDWEREEVPSPRHLGGCRLKSR